MLPKTCKESSFLLFLSTQEELNAFCERASASRVIAVDTEFLREKTYYPRLCLVQVNTGSEIACVDPISIPNLDPLAELFEDPDVVKVFHACSQDLEVIYDAMGCVCENVFDTQVAAAFLGLRQQIGYGQLVESFCGVHLAKAEALTDWSRRPLDPEQLVYAEDDVRYLPSIYEQMISKLIKLDRLSWVGPEMREVSDPARIKKDPLDAYLKLRRANSLTRRQLAVAREVCCWREEAAAARDVPRKWLLSDEVIVEICRRTPMALPRLRRVRGLEKIPEAEARAIIAAVEKGLACPADQCPVPVKRPKPSADSEGAVDLMMAVVKVVADKAGLAPQVLATKDDLVEYLAAAEGSRLSSGWRGELVGKPLSRLLAGELGLTLVDGKIELL